MCTRISLLLKYPKNVLTAVVLEEYKNNNPKYTNNPLKEDKKRWNSG